MLKMMIDNVDIEYRDWVFKQLRTTFIKTMQLSGRTHNSGQGWKDN